MGALECVILSRDIKLGNSENDKQRLEEGEVDNASTSWKSMTGRDLSKRKGSVAHLRTEANPLEQNEQVRE